MQLKNTDGMTASIHVNGERLPEHGLATNYTGSTASCHIEAVSNAEFSICVSVDETHMRKSHNAICYSIYLDGKRAKTKTISDFDRNGYARDESRGVHSIVGGQKMRSSYKFGDLTTSDEPSQHMNVDEAKRLDLDRGNYPGESLKGRAISHMTTLGALRLSRKQRSRNKHEKVVDYKKIADFVFRYRSRRDLQIEGIIPRDPSPLGSVEGVPDAMTVEQAREVLRRHELAEHAGGDQPGSLKSDPGRIITKDEDHEEVTAFAKTSSSHDQRHGRIKREVEVIDMTGDD